MPGIHLSYGLLQGGNRPVPRKSFLTVQSIKRWNASRSDAVTSIYKQHVSCVAKWKITVSVALLVTTIPLINHYYTYTLPSNPKENINLPPPPPPPPPGAACSTLLR